MRAWDYAIPHFHPNQEGNWVYSLESSSMNSVITPLSSRFLPGSFNGKLMHSIVNYGKYSIRRLWEVLVRQVSIVGLTTR